MAAPLSDFFLGVDPDSAAPVVIVEDDFYADTASLLAGFPELAEAANASLLARVMCHFAQGSRFRVIEDPAAFVAAYRATRGAEDPARPWRQGEYKLSDYGLPDFGLIHAPRIQGGNIMFFASDALIGLPYRVTGDARGAPLQDSDFRPMAMAGAGPRPEPAPDKPAPDEAASRKLPGTGE